jgi:hypothetical protein
MDRLRLLPWHGPACFSRSAHNSIRQYIAGGSSDDQKVLNLYFSILYCGCVGDLTEWSNGQAVACPRAAEKWRRTEVAVPYTGSAGAVGWRAITLQTAASVRVPWRAHREGYQNS